MRTVLLPHPREIEARVPPGRREKDAYEGKRRECASDTGYVIHFLNASAPLSVRDILLHESSFAGSSHLKAPDEPGHTVGYDEDDDRSKDELDVPGTFEITRQQSMSYRGHR